MAETLASIAMEQLFSISVSVVKKEVRLVASVTKEVQNLSTTFASIQAVFKDADEKQVMNESVKAWLEALKNVAYDVDDLCDEWRSTRNSISHMEGANNSSWRPKVCSYFFSPCFGFSRIVLGHNIGHKIKDIRERLDMIAKDKNQFNFNSSRSIEQPVRYETSSVINALEVFGRDEDKDIITSKLLGESSENKMGLSVISIVGMGGIGKTTFAQLAYNDERVITHFSYKIWVCVSEPFDMIRIAKEIIKGIDGTNVPDDSSWDILHRSLSDTVKEKQFLLVLDDVWTEDYRMWEPLMHSLKCGVPGSRVLVTTRKEGVAQMMGTTYMHRLGTLYEEECWSLLSAIAFLGWEKEESEKMKEIGEEIARKCKGLPLSAKALGGLLRSKRTKQEWQNVLRSEIWGSKEVEKDVLPALLLSYYDLPSHLKPCFQYYAVFPKDYLFSRDMLIRLWIAQGFIRSGGSRGGGELEVKGEEYFTNLATRSFFQDFKKDNDGNIEYCKMHDMVHDFAQFVTENECFIMDSSKNSSDWNCKSKARHSTVVNDSNSDSTLSTICNFKNLRTLIFNEFWLSLTALPSDLFSQLTCLRALDLSGTIIEALPNEVEKLIHLRYLDLSYNEELRKLPETVCKLYNLQTLILTFCSRLCELPKGIGKLISLRHLDLFLTNISYLPQEIGRLSSLQTIYPFIVGGGASGCKFGDLKNLNLLRGILSIDVRAGYEANLNDAKEAGLRNKQHLRLLRINFHDLNELASSVGGSRGKEEEERMEGVIENLQPHPDLERLEICNYPSTKLPKNWLMRDDAVVSSSSLVTLDLYNCRNLMQLSHSLGKLPSLQNLELDKMDAVTYVGHEFFGIGDTDDGIISLDVFPKLTKLHLGDLSNWEEWDMRTRFKDDDILIMPRLNYLELENCPKLKALPHHFLQNRALKTLRISNCSVLEGSCQKEAGED